MRTIFVGDVHGCIDELTLLVEKVGFRRGEDDLVLLGDLLDKGPDGAACVRFAREVGARCLMGNHEEKNLRWRKRQQESVATGKKNPVSLPADYQEQHSRLSSEDFAWLEALPASIDTGAGLVAVHAGLLPGVPFAEQHPREVMRLRWVRGGKMVPLTSDLDPHAVPEGAANWSEAWDGPQGVVYGHAVHSLSTPKIDRRWSNPRTWCFGIDTGCVHGGRLTALVFENEHYEFVQVDAKRVYSRMLGQQG